MLLFFKKEGLLFLLAMLLAAAPTTPMMTALRAQNWPAAQTLATQETDPHLAGDLVDFIRMLKPAQANDREIQAFLELHPGWPDRAVLARRLGEAVADDPDDSGVLPICLGGHFAARPLARCAAAYAAAGRQAQAAEAARSAWVGGITDPSEESVFLARWSAVLTPADEWRRFAGLVNADPAAAARQITRLESGHRLAALARLAWKHDDTDAAARLALVPEALRGDPALVLENARSLRRMGALAAAAALWHAAGVGAEAAAPADARAPFWSEREALARKLLTAGSDADAAFLADDPLAGGDQAVESLFLSGWIALRRLHDVPKAAAKFEALAARSHSAITQGRAHYWLARTLQEQGKPAETLREYAASAAWPTTYYGQLAAGALGDEAVRLRALADPVWTPAQAQDLARADLVRAAQLLVAWGDAPRARDFLLRLGETMTGDSDRSWAAHFALRLSMPDVAVQIARMAGRAGGMLPQAGWPSPVTVPQENGPLVLAVIRQESNFDPGVTSPVGARGLMQVMPATARSMAAGNADLFDPAANIRVGSAYLQQLLEQFAGETAPAIAAYNAGPNRVHAWVAASDPGRDPAALIDWIETIPYAETRNYVQRVLEGETIYASRTGAQHDP